MATHEKKVDTWWFNLQDLLDKQVQKHPGSEAEEGEEPETISRVDERKIPVEVFMAKEMDEAKTPPHPVDKVWFVVKCKQSQYKVNFTIEGPDITCLKDQAWSLLDERFEIEWFEYYLVTISPARIYEGQGDGLELSYKSVWKGITWEGKVLLKEYHRGRDYDDNYRIKPWPGKFTERDGTVIACIPENDMTKSALDEFCKKIVMVREALEKMVTPEAIMHTLTNISGLKLLQAANDQVAQEEQTKNERQKENSSNGDESR
jgi:hypothetical protein